MVVVASDAQYVTGPNYSGILIFFPVNIYVEGWGRYVENFALDTVSKFSHWYGRSVLSIIRNMAQLYTFF
jgi:hypothetical protein